MASGNKESFDYCKNVFEKIANKVFFLGESGVAHSVKLAINHFECLFFTHSGFEICRV